MSDSARPRLQIKRAGYEIEDGRVRCKMVDAEQAAISELVPRPRVPGPDARSVRFLFDFVFAWPRWTQVNELIGKSRMAPNLISSRRPNNPLERLRENMSPPVPSATVTDTLASVQLPR